MQYLTDNTFGGGRSIGGRLTGVQLFITSENGLTSHLGQRNFLFFCFIAQTKFNCRVSYSKST